MTDRRNCCGGKSPHSGARRILFGTFVAEKQKAALRFADSFAPKSKFSLFLRNKIFNLMSIGWVANLALGSGLADKIVLPDY
jgi:hypothetical protein